MGRKKINPEIKKKNTYKSKLKWRKDNRNYEKKRCRIRKFDEIHVEQNRLSQLRYSKKNKAKLKAHRLAEKLPLKEKCEICGSKNILERHHWRYDKPLYFSTLCSTCHKHVKIFKNSIYGGD